MIYADNAATTQLDADAFETMRCFLMEKYGNASQAYSFGVEAKKAIKKSREKIAKCIGADPEEIYFTSGGTESNNWAIKMGAGRNGDIITSVIEHHAILRPCEILERWRRNVIYAPVSLTGEIDLEFIRKNITDRTRLLSVMFANNEIGTIQPVEKLADIAHNYACIFHTDAVQAVGHVEINVHDLGIDMLSASAHKFNGPKGIGFLFIRRGVDIGAFMDGGSQEYGLRAGTENTASIAGMAVALEKNCQNIRANERHLKDLESLLLSALSDAGIRYIRNGGGHMLPGNVSLSFADVTGEMLLHRMDLQGICISTGSACDSVNTQISHVIQAIQVPEEFAEGTVRISFGKDNTRDEVYQIAGALIDIIRNQS